jgi:hypothetical protein
MDLDMDMDEKHAGGKNFGTWGWSSKYAAGVTLMQNLHKIKAEYRGKEN